MGLIFLGPSPCVSMYTCMYARACLYVYEFKYI